MNIRMRTQEKQEPPVGLGSWLHAAIFLMACALFIARRPEAVLHAQFYAEDGHVWLADAYNRGWWQALFLTWTGYFMTLPRLGAGVALLAPLPFAPLVLNVIAIAAQALPVSLLLLSRSSVWGSLRFRMAMAVIYISLPNSAEISFGITESQWVVALAAFLLLVASTPNGRYARLLDCLFILLAGLSGPFCIFMLPISAFLAWHRLQPWRWVPVAILACCSLVQICGLIILDPSGRPRHALGTSIGLFTRILGGHVFLGTLLGSNRMAAEPRLGFVVFLAFAALAGTCITVYCFIESVVEVRLFLLLSVMLLGASLITSTTNPVAGSSVWQTLAEAGGIRYWFFPTLAFAWSLLWCTRLPSPPFRIFASALLCIMIIGVVHNWRQPPFQEPEFGEAARRFSAAPAGTAATFPLYPPGWTMRLVKH
jgi:hypothetical protein